MINSVTLSGNLGKNAELKQSSLGTPVLQFSLAVSERIKRGNNWEDYTNWFNCVMFGERAQKLAQHLTCGVRVSVQGRLKYRSWQDSQTQQTRSAVEVIVNEIVFMSAKNAHMQQPAQTQQQQPQQQPTQQVEVKYFDDSDIPF